MNFDQTQALQEGWCVIENSTGRLEIQKDDDSAAFIDDAAALSHVTRRSRAYPSGYHAQALSYVESCNTDNDSPVRGTLTIVGVDLELLEKQRRSLQRVIGCLAGWAAHVLPGVTTEDVENLEGLENMLNTWSDERYFR